MTRKAITIGDFLTLEEAQRCIELYTTCSPGTFATTVAKEIIEPNIKRINKALGQENDPKFLAYMVEYVLMQHRKENP